MVRNNPTFCGIMWAIKNRNMSKSQPMEWSEKQKEAISKFKEIIKTQMETTGQNEKLDLETLKRVKFMFDIHSDHSTKCNGYRSLCTLIEHEEKKATEIKVYEPNPEAKYIAGIDRPIEEKTEIQEYIHNGDNFRYVLVLKDPNKIGYKDVYKFLTPLYPNCKFDITCYGINNQYVVLPTEPIEILHKHNKLQEWFVKNQ